MRGGGGGAGSCHIDRGHAHVEKGRTCQQVVRKQHPIALWELQGQHSEGDVVVTASLVQLYSSGDQHGWQALLEPHSETTESWTHNPCISPTSSQNQNSLKQRPITLECIRAGQISAA